MLSLNNAVYGMIGRLSVLPLYMNRITVGMGLKRRQIFITGAKSPHITAQTGAWSRRSFNSSLGVVESTTVLIIYYRVLRIIMDSNKLPHEIREDYICIWIPIVVVIEVVR